MAHFIITGNYTPYALRGMVANPSDREAATRALIESAGGRLLSYYMTTGEFDFHMVVEAPDIKGMLGALIAAGASGATHGLRTAQAFTGAEFMAAQNEASRIAENYSAPA